MNRPAAVVAVSLLAFAAQAGEVRVAVASNFAIAAKAIGDSFQEATGHRVVLSSGSTGKLYAQIVHGAPFDVFLAADEARPARLEDDRLAVRGSRFTYALGRLVLWSAEPDRATDGPRTLSAPGSLRLAIANPALAPYGAAARETLTALGLWERYRDRAVRGENVSQAFQFVAGGAADVGFVADSVLIAAEAGGSRWTVPAELHDQIAQQAVLLLRARDHRPAVSFLAYLRGEAAAAVIERSGYDVPGLRGPP